MLTLAWRRQWWKDLASCPVFDVAREDSAIAGLVALVAETSAGTAAPRTVKDAEKVQENMRGKHKNAFHLCYSIQSNITSYRLFRIVLTLGGRARHLLGTSIKLIESGSPKALWTCLSWAAGEQNIWLKDILAQSTLSTSLSACGFEHEDLDSWSDTPEVCVQEEDELATRFMTLTRQIVAHVGLSSLDYSSNLPNLFLLLLHHDAASQRDGCNQIRQIWEAAQHLEHPTSHELMHNYARTLVWPAMSSNPQLCIAMEEQAWQPAEDVQRLITLAFSTPLQTKIVEDGFNIIQDCVQVHKSRSVEKMNMQSSLLESRLVTTYGCTSTLGEFAPQEVPSKLPAKIWSPDAGEFSVGGRKTYRSYPQMKAGIIVVPKVLLSYRWLWQPWFTAPRGIGLDCSSCGGLC